MVCLLFVHIGGLPFQLIGGNETNVLNSLTAIDGHDRQYFNELRSSTVVSRRIFIRSQSLIAR